KPPQIPYISNVTGTWITPEQATDPAYWVAHLRQCVRFSAGVAALAGQCDCAFLEVGPGRALGNLTRRQVDAAGRHMILSSFPAKSGSGSEAESMLSSLGTLWLEGATIDWSGFYRHERRRRVYVPSYPFERRRYWIEATPARSAAVVEDQIDV